jgi:hypothetical protein
MSACDRFRALAAHEAAGTLTARQFAGLDAHRESCPGCAAEAREGEPLRLFRALRDETREPAFWAGFDHALRAGMQEEGHLGFAESLQLLRPAYRVALAAVLVLGLGLTAGLLAPEFQRQAVPDLDGSARLVQLQDTSLPEGEVLPPTVESIRSDEATVYEMKVFGEGNEVTQLVMIFDEGIDL